MGIGYSKHFHIIAPKPVSTTTASLFSTEWRVSLLTVRRQSRTVTKPSFRIRSISCG
jgi:hypothetical protein